MPLGASERKPGRACFQIKQMLEKSRDKWGEASHAMLKSWRSLLLCELATCVCFVHAYTCACVCMCACVCVEREAIFGGFQHSEEDLPCLYSKKSPNIVQNTECSIPGSLMCANWKFQVGQVGGSIASDAENLAKPFAL